MADKKMQSDWLNFYNSILYNTLAPFYAALDWLTLGAWWQLVSRALDYVPERKQVLEIGFGPGKLHVELVRRSTVCVGLDLARGMCRLTQRRLAHAGLLGQLTQGSILALPYRDQSFDTIVSTFTLPGILDGAKSIQEMTRVARTGGRLVLVDVGLPSDENPTGIFWARLWERMGVILHDHIELMCQSGLTVDTYEEFGPGKHIRIIVAKKKRPGYL